MVAFYSGARQLVSQRLGEAALGRLGRPVHGGPRERAQAGAARDDHDVPASAVEHAGQRGGDRVDGPQPVDPRHALDLVHVHVAERPVVRHPRVGDDDVHRAELGDRLRHLTGVTDVGGERLVALARQRQRKLVQLLLGARHQPDLASALRERLGDGATDAARRSGDHHACSCADIHVRHPS
jgi:hypothetical protein